MFKSMKLKSQHCFLWKLSLKEYATWLSIIVTNCNLSKTFFINANLYPNIIGISIIKYYNFENGSGQI